MIRSLHLLLFHNRFHTYYHCSRSTLKIQRSIYQRNSRKNPVRANTSFCVRSDRILCVMMFRYTSYEPYIQRLAGCVIELSIQGADASWIMLYKRLLLERNNCSIIFLVDEVLDLIRFEYIYQCFHTFVFLISFFYNNYIYISFSCFGIRFLICKGIF